MDKWEGCICLQDEHHRNCPAIKTGKCHYQSLYRVAPGEAVGRETRDTVIEILKNCAADYCHPQTRNPENPQWRIDCAIANGVKILESELSTLRRERDQIERNTIELWAAAQHYFADQCDTARAELRKILTATDPPNEMLARYDAHELKIEKLESQVRELTAQREHEHERAESYGRIAGKYLGEKYELESQVAELRAAVEKLTAKVTDYENRTGEAKGI